MAPDAYVARLRALWTRLRSANAWRRRRPRREAPVARKKPGKAAGR